jgi:DNA-binding response OmpR family regulator
MGREGLRRFASGRFHVVVTDVRMPGPDGWEVARRLREASAEDGCQLAILAKPFTLEQLTATIDRLVAVRQAA